MKSKNIDKNIIVLFDEHGTPTFDNRETDIFLGVAVVYDINYEKELFKKCNDQFGLSNKNPLKNNRINTTRALNIVKLLNEIKLEIEVATINLCNTDLQRVVTLYEDYGNVLREFHRGVRGRPKAQIIHEEIQSYVVFYIISKYIEKYPSSTFFSIFIDSWSFPNNDISIAVELASKSIENKINEINRIFFSDVKVRLDKFSLLEEDSSRKRFIDVITSVVSRKYKQKNNPRFLNSEYFNSIIDETDITNSTIGFLKECMDNLSREG